MVLHPLLWPFTLVSLMLSFSSLARWTGVVATLGLLFSVPLGCSTSGDEDDDSSSDGGGGLGGSSNDTEQLPKCDFGDDEDKCGGYAKCGRCGT